MIDEQKDAEVRTDRDLAVKRDLRGGLVVSCQAPAGSLLRDPDIQARIARTAYLGGAVGVRLNGPEDVAAAAGCVDVPIIGLHKVPGRRRFVITPTFELAAGLAAAGAHIVALDCTVEARGTDLSDVARIQAELGRLVMADVSTLDEGLRAWESGADLVGTTLSGYTPDSPPPPDDAPDLDLIHALVERGVDVAAEGRFRSPAQVRAAFEAGAHTVVVGGAITDPFTMTRLFVAATPSAR